MAPMPTPRVDREAIEFGREFETPSSRFGAEHEIRDVPRVNPEALNQPERYLSQGSTERLGHLAQTASGITPPMPRLETFEV
jgi:hypothetical protein